MFIIFVTINKTKFYGKKQKEWVNSFDILSIGFCCASLPRNVPIPIFIPLLSKFNDTSPIHCNSFKIINFFFLILPNKLNI